VDGDDRAAHRANHGAARGEGARLAEVQAIGESTLDDADDPGLPRYDDRQVLRFGHATPENETTREARRRLEDRIREKREVERMKGGFYLEERPQQDDAEPEEENDSDEPEAD
jgi:hypothetical protein